MYDQQVFALSEVQAGQHQSYTHHSWHSTVQSLHICQTQVQNEKSVRCSRNAVSHQVINIESFAAQADAQFNKDVKDLQPF